MQFQVIVTKFQAKRKVFEPKSNQIFELIHGILEILNEEEDEILYVLYAFIPCPI